MANRSWLTRPQTAFFTGFICLLVIAIVRVSRLGLSGRMLRNLKILLYTNDAAAMFILLRTVYRLAVECQGEFLDDFHGCHCAASMDSGAQLG